MMNRILEFVSQCPRVFWSDTCHQDTPLVLQKLGSNLENLFRRFARSKNDFGKAFAQRSMQINLCESKVSHGRSLERSDDLVAANAAGTKFLE